MVVAGLVVALEAVAVIGGLALINGVPHRSAVAVAWVTVVVCVLFFGLGRILSMPLYYRSRVPPSVAALPAVGVPGYPACP